MLHMKQGLGTVAFQGCTNFIDIMTQLVQTESGEKTEAISRGNEKTICHLGLVQSGLKYVLQHYDGKFQGWYPAQMVQHCFGSKGSQQEVEMGQCLPSFLQKDFKKHLCKSYHKDASRKNFSPIFVLMSLLLGGIRLTCDMVGNSSEQKVPRTWCGDYIISYNFCGCRCSLPII